MSNEYESTTTTSSSPQTTGGESQSSRSREQLKGIEGYDAQAAAVAPPEEEPDPREEALRRLYRLSNSYLAWVQNNCIIPDDKTFLYVRDRLHKDPYATLDLYSRATQPDTNRMFGEIADDCAWIPVAAKVMGVGVIILSGVAWGSAAATGAAAVDLALGSKWMLDAARMIAVELTSNSDYDNFNDWLFFHLGIKRTIMKEWAAAEGLSLSADDMDAIRAVFKNARA